MTATKLCTFPGCGRAHSGRGLCGSHLKQDRAGQELRALRPFTPPPCIIDDCAEVERLTAVVRRVRELHRESRGSMSALYPSLICECGKDYPCPTIRALDAPGGVS